MFDDLFSPVWDETLLDGASRSARGPDWWRLAVEVQRRRDEYDAIVSWSERLSLALMMLQRSARGRRPHIAMMGQFAKPNIRVPLQLFGRSLHAVVTWTSVQRRYLVEALRFPADRVYLIRHYVDQVFYQPQATEDEMICAVGAEMRDYVTLMEALRGTALRCHVATDHVRIPGRLRWFKDRRVSIDAIPAPAESAVTTGRMTLVELRRLYAHSRFVVVPLLHSESDNGVTVILEAMAMGKPVICSRTRGQVDVVQDGVTGLFVPVGDPTALRDAIVSLWNDPERAREMGRRARAYVESHHSMELFSARVRSAVEASLDGRPAPDGWWEE